MKLVFVRPLLHVSGCALALLAASPAFALQSTSTFDWAQSARIVQPSGPPSDEFGASIALASDTLAIGAPKQDTVIGTDSGAVHVYRRTAGAWTLEQLLLPSPQTYNSWMGSSVAISGDTLAIGAPRHYLSSSSRGAVYVFTRTGTQWNLQQFLTIAAGDRFGTCVALDGDTLVVGDPMGLFLSGPGSATVWQRTGAVWTMQAVLTNPSSVSGADFGTSVAIDGERVVVGAPNDTASGTVQAGKVSVFERSGTVWSQLLDAHASPPRFNDGFGISVTIAGDVFAVGAPTRQPPLGQHTGSVSVFRITGANAVQEAELAPKDIDANPDMTFGSSVALDGPNLAIGAPSDDMAAHGSGSVYLYTSSASIWTRSEKLAAHAGVGHVGHALAFDSGSIAAGSQFLAVTVFDPVTPPLATGFCFGDGSTGLPCPCHNSVAGAEQGCRDPYHGHGSNLFPLGTNSVAANDLSLYVRLMPWNTKCVLVTSLQSSSGTSFGNGLTCLSGNLMSLGSRDSPFPGIASWNPDLGQPGFAAPGVTRYFQVWIRNRPFGGCSGHKNASSALAVTFTP